MDIGILAAEMNKWQWQVKRHFKPDVFNSLDTKTKEKYATVFKVTMDELINLR